MPVTVVASSRRRCAPRSSGTSPRSPWPGAPAAGIASARRGGTPCAAGVGFAVHRLAHHPAHRRLRSCARSCGASAHLAPHRAGQSCPHQCGHRRRRCRHSAAHDPVQHPLHVPPLNRRAGSDEAPSPATISRTSMLPIGRPGPPGAALVLTPHASVMLAPPCASLLCAPRPRRCLPTPRCCWTERGTIPLPRRSASRHRKVAIVQDRYTIDYRSLPAGVRPSLWRYTPNRPPTAGHPPQFWKTIPYREADSTACSPDNARWSRVRVRLRARDLVASEAQKRAFRAANTT